MLWTLIYQRPFFVLGIDKYALRCYNSIIKRGENEMKKMKANFEIQATRKNGTQTVFTLVSAVYHGVAADIYDRC